MSRPVPVHLLLDDELIACTLASLGDAARPADSDPPRVTIHLHDTTCTACLRRARPADGASA